MSTTRMTLDELIKRWAGCPQNDLHDALREAAREATVAAIIADIIEMMDINPELAARVAGMSGEALEARLRELLKEALRHD